MLLPCIDKEQQSTEFKDAGDKGSDRSASDTQFREASYAENQQRVQHGVDAERRRVDHCRYF